MPLLFLPHRRKSRASECVIDLVSDTEDDVVSVDPQHASFFRVISWNIDGLSTKSRGFRTAEVLAIIKRSVLPKCHSRLARMPTVTNRIQRSRLFSMHVRSAFFLLTGRGFTSSVCKRLFERAWPTLNWRWAQCTPSSILTTSPLVTTFQLSAY